MIKNVLLGLLRQTQIIRLLFTRDYIKYARRLGVTIGDNSKLVVHPHFWSMPDFGSEPYLITIGNHTEISFGCTFLTHDGSNWSFREREEYRDVIIGGSITIGDNTFIGCNTTILSGVTIGSNVIIGACSLVTKDVPDGQVWAGTPAKYLETTEEFAKKCFTSNPVHPPITKHNKREVLMKVYKGNGYKIEESKANS